MKNSITISRMILLVVIGFMLATCQKEDALLLNSEDYTDTEVPQLKSVVYNEYQWYHLAFTFDAINDLLSEGYLNKGNANALIVKYNAAWENLWKGNYDAAEGNLTALINLVEDLTEEGKISPEQAEDLVQIPAAIIESFKYQCGDPITDARDGQTYETVQIGGQCWMAENLNFQIFADNGYPLSFDYDNNPANGDTYGRLYSMSTYVLLFACPIGWHLPSDEEWKTLEKYLGMTDSDVDDTGLRSSGDVGYKLKSTSDWLGYPGWDGNGDNSSGFNALPGGASAKPGDDFVKLGMQANFWSSTPALTSGLKYWLRRIDSNWNNGVYRISDLNQRGYSIRCVKND